MSNPFLHFWNAVAEAKRGQDRWYRYVAAGNTLDLPKGNGYVEHDIGTKNVRYPDGSTRSVATRKIRDTAGTTFYTFAESTRLS